MKKLLQFPLLLVGLSIASVGISADRVDSEAGAYIGAGAGYYRLNDDDFLDQNDDLKDNRGAWRGYVGFEAGRIFAIEAAYTDFGEPSDGIAEMELTGVSGAILISIPIVEVIAPYGKIGVIAWDRDRSFGPLTASDDGDDMFYGLGARFSLAPSVDMRLEYERYAIDETDLDMGSVNLQYRF